VPVASRSHVQHSHYEPDRVATVAMASRIYGDRGVALDDPAEAYHEASKLYPSFSMRQMFGAVQLAAHRELQMSSQRSVKRNRNLPAVDLPTPAYARVTLEEAIRSRHSGREFAPASVSLVELATLLHAAYGVTRRARDGSEQTFRTVPSGGALYPLEVYCAVSRVDGVPPGLYHFDPPRRVLERYRLLGSANELVRASTYPELVESCAVTFLVTAMFWRTRFKYGLRGYRFALLEAGHVVQNVVLACAALGLAAVPLGGFYDRLVDEFLGVDGVNESSLYCVCVGRRRGET
jgi:SagB-type dehydrogenase family enzyme